MSAKDYMRVNSDKTVTVDINKCGGKGFIDAVKTRDIARATILSRDKRKQLGRGSDDVVMQYASGGKERISRAQLERDYLTRSGKKLKISHLKSNTPYLVISNKPKNYAVMMLPANMHGTLNGKQIPAGAYIVAPKNQNGDIDISKATVLHKSKFKKMFKIPPQEIITNNISNRGNKVSRRITSNIASRGLGNNAQKQAINTPTCNTMQRPINNMQQKNMQTQQRPVQQRPTQQQQQRADQLKMVGRLFSSASDELVGYLFIDRAGKQYKKNINDTMKLCHEHKVVNAMVQRHPNGKYFLRGNDGTVIDRLPKYLV